MPPVTKKTEVITMLGDLYRLGATYEHALEQAQKFVCLLHGQNKAMVQLAKLENGKMKYYRSYRGTALPSILQDSSEYQWLEHEDVYVALNVFSGVKRTEEELVGFNALYTDLDFYKHGISKATARAEIQRMIDSGEIISPSIIVDSGRGYQLIWLMDFMKNTHNYRLLWRRMQNEIADRFAHLNSDTAAKLVTQIYRLVGSWSSKSGTMITFEHLADRYSIGELKEALLPDISDITTRKKPVNKPKSVRKKSAYKELKLSPYSLYNARKSDIEALVSLRNGDVNRRRLMFFYAVTALEVYKGDVKRLEMAMDELNDRLWKPLSKSTLEADRASAVRSFEMRQTNKRQGYQFSNAHILEHLEITEDEQQFMSTLIGAEEKARRKRIASEKKRREKGMKTALEYKQERLDKTSQQLETLKAMLAENPKVKRKEIAEKLNVGLVRVDKLKAQLRKQQEL